MPDDQGKEAPVFGVEVNQIDWDRFFKIGLETILGEKSVPGWLASVGSDAVPKIAATIIAIILRLEWELGKALGRALDNIEGVSGAEMRRMVAVGLTDIFGVQVSPGELEGAGGIANPRALAERLGEEVFSAMFGAFGAGPEVTPEQGRDNAERMLGFNISTTLEGWMLGILGTGVLTRYFPNWADLDDVLTSNLGLGRINRRILQPILDATVIEPFQRHINATYRPKQFSEAEALRALRVGFIDQETWFQIMAEKGWTRERAAIWSATQYRIPDVNVLVQMFEVGFLNDDVAIGLLKASGYQEAWAEGVWKAAKNDRLRATHNAVETTARDLFQKNRIGASEFRDLLKAAARTDDEVEALMGLAQVEHTGNPRPPDGTFEKAFVEGLISLGDLRDAYREKGFSDRDITMLEQLALAEKIEHDAREKRAVEAPAEPKRAAPAKMEAAFQDGLISEAELGSYYESQGIIPGDIEILLELARRRKAGQGT